MIDQRLQIVGGESRLVDNEVSFYDGDPQNEKAKWQHWIDNPVFMRQYTTNSRISIIGYR